MVRVRVLHTANFAACATVTVDEQEAAVVLRDRTGIELQIAPAVGF